MGSYQQFFSRLYLHISPQYRQAYENTVWEHEAHQEWLASL